MSTFTHPAVVCTSHNTPARHVVEFAEPIGPYGHDFTKHYLLACGDPACFDGAWQLAEVYSQHVTAYPLTAADAEAITGVYTGLVSDSAVDSAGRHWVLVDPSDNQATALWECPASGEGALWQELAGLIVQQWCAGRFGDRGCSR